MERLEQTVFGPKAEYNAVMDQIREDREVYDQFLGLSEPMKEELVEFCMGVRGVKITYDPFFKFVFDPEVNPERLEDLIGLCLRQKARIMAVIPNESKRITEESSLMVMDVLVRLESGDFVNVEIQRFGYLFPGARCACYSSDLLMRQYSQVRARTRKEKRRFSYGDIKKVYTIVLMQQSPKEFHDHPGKYLHYARQKFNTGLNYDMLQEYVLVPLDIFLKIPHNELSRLDAWLYFIASDGMKDICRVIEAYPEFREIYREVFQFRYQVKEVMGMFSEALRILDANTTQYMIEEQQKELAEQKKELLERCQELEAGRLELEIIHRELEEAWRENEQLRTLLREREK